MSVIRVVKDKNYVAMGKYHLREREMSLKAKGLLSQMLSLPDNWDYSVNGLTTINKESYDTIRGILNELEQFGYLQRTQIKNEQGKFIDVEYTIHEKPITEKPITEIPLTENSGQLNNKKLNNNLINKENNKRKFTKPTLEEVEEYIKERNSSVNPKVFFDYYEVNNWKDIKNWKQKLITWESHQTKKEEKPTWFNETQDNHFTKEEEQEFQDILGGFK